MSKISIQKSKTTKQLAEDVAYTFKGLYKTSDLIEIFYNFSLITSIILGLILIAFRIEIEIAQMVSIFALFLTLLPLIYQNYVKKVSHYRILANKFKDIYDEIRRRNNNGNFKTSDLLKGISKIRQQTSDYPINFIAKIWVTRTIDKEMDLGWLRE